MPTKRFTEKQILRALQWRKQGKPVATICRELQISPATLYRHLSDRNSVRWPAIDRDWHELSKSWQCVLIERVASEAARRLRREVGLVFRQVFSRPAENRTTVTARELRSFTSDLQRCLDAYDALSERAQDHLEEIREQSDVGESLPSLLARVKSLAGQAKDHTQALSGHVLQKGQAAGGRHADPRIPRAVVALATVYAREFRQHPLHRTDPDSGEPIGEFNSFVEEAFDHFVPDLRPPKTALREAMRHAAARIDYSEDFDSD